MLFQPIPDELLNKCDHPGTMHRFTYSSQSYDGENRPVTKEALVYLPYGYDAQPERTYPVLYLMHGGGGDQNAFFGGIEAAAPLKTILDQSFATGRAQPMIVVAPTFTVPGWPEDQRAIPTAWKLTHRFPKEFAADLVPAIDRAFRTVPERGARAFGGFSMGGESTWSIMAQCLNLVGVYMPLSGDYWAIDIRGGEAFPVETADALIAAMEEAGVTPKDYRVLAFTGDQDIAFAAMDPLVRELATRTKWFAWGEEPGEGNLCYCLKKDGLHTYEACYEYIRLALPHLFV